MILEERLKHIIQSFDKNSLNILVDYSCMTKLWYASIINYLILQEEDFRKIRLFFSYTPAEFSIRKKIKLPSKVSSLSMGLSKFDPSKPTALLIGMGIEKGLSRFIYKKIKPEFCCLMYADPAPDENYVRDVFDNNQEVINLVDVRNLVSYPLNDLEKTDEILTDICLQLRLRYNVILVSVGPKVFSLSCLLLAIRYPDVDVWRVSASQNSTIVDRIPVGNPIILEVVLSGRDDDY